MTVVTLSYLLSGVTTPKMKNSSCIPCISELWPYNLDHNSTLFGKRNIRWL